MEPEILFDDKKICVCVKPVGILSEEGGMPELLRAEGQQAYCVHRLDRAVGGVMVYARTAQCAAKLSSMSEARQLKKTYLAVLPAPLSESSGVLRDLLFKDAAKNKTYVVKRMRCGVREAELEYDTLEILPEAVLLKITLHTGRSHQIRAQFAFRGLPLLGDVKYGSRFRTCPIALWSYSLCFAHPITGETVSFAAPPPRCSPWNYFSKFT